MAQCCLTINKFAIVTFIYQHFGFILFCNNKDDSPPLLLILKRNYQQKCRKEESLQGIDSVSQIGPTRMRSGRNWSIKLNYLQFSSRGVLTCSIQVCWIDVPLVTVWTLHAHNHMSSWGIPVYVETPRVPTYIYTDFRYYVLGGVFISEHVHLTCFSLTMLLNLLLRSSHLGVHANVLLRSSHLGAHIKMRS